MVRSQPELLLRVLSVSMAMQVSGSVSDVRGSPENMGVPLVGEANVDVQGLCRTDLTSLLLQHSCELDPLPPGSNTAGPCSSPRRHPRADPRGGNRGKPVLRV